MASIRDLRGRIRSVGNIRQIIPELMPTPIEYADNCSWEFGCIQGKMGKGYYFVIATVIQENSGDCRELCGKVLR